MIDLVLQHVFNGVTTPPPTRTSHGLNTDVPRFLQVYPPLQNYVAYGFQATMLNVLSCHVATRPTRANGTNLELDRDDPGVDDGRARLPTDPSSRAARLDLPLDDLLVPFLVSPSQP